MFGKKELVNRLESAEQAINSLKEQIEGDDRVEQTEQRLLEKLERIEDQIEPLQTEDSLFINFSKRLADFEELLVKLEKRVNNFASFEKATTTQLVKKTENELEKKLKFLDSVQVRYKEFDARMREIQKDVAAVAKEFARLSKISASLKESDFTLKNFSHELDKRDKDIRRLERENEKMKSLVARQRRKQ